MNYDILVMGSATQDVFAKSNGAETINVDQGHGVEELIAYPLGTKLLINELHFEIGGGGTNTACTFARQGLKTGFIGKIGKDSAGIGVMKFLKEENINFLGGISTHGKTGYSVILDSKNDDRTILTHKGCNNELFFSDIKSFSKVSTKWFYASSMMEESFETMKKVMIALKKKGTKIVFNPSSYQVKQGLTFLAHVLSLLDLLVLNEEEAKTLVSDSYEREELLLKLKSLGPKNVCVTMGAKGACFLDETKKYYFIEPKHDFEVLETTGAGDAFASGLVTGLIENFSIDTALKLGMLNAESVISQYGAKNHILNHEEVSTLLLEDKRKVVIGNCK